MKWVAFEVHSSWKWRLKLMGVDDYAQTMGWEPTVGHHRIGKDFVGWIGYNLIGQSVGG